MEVTEESIVQIYEIISKNVVNELSSKSGKKQMLIRFMIEKARLERI